MLCGALCSVPQSVTDPRALCWSRDLGKVASSVLVLCEWPCLGLGRDTFLASAEFHAYEPSALKYQLLKIWCCTFWIGASTFLFTHHSVIQLPCPSNRVYRLLAHGESITPFLVARRLVGPSPWLPTPCHSPQRRLHCYRSDRHP